MLVVRLEGEWGVNEVRRKLESQAEITEIACPKNGLALELWNLKNVRCQYLCTSSRSVSFRKCARTL